MAHAGEVSTARMRRLFTRSARTTVECQNPSLANSKRSFVSVPSQNVQTPPEERSWSW